MEYFSVVPLVGKLEEKRRIESHKNLGIFKEGLLYVAKFTKINPIFHPEASILSHKLEKLNSH